MRWHIIRSIPAALIGTPAFWRWNPPNIGFVGDKKLERLDLLQRESGCDGGRVRTEERIAVLT
jgi:hypothetical protein